MSRDLSNAELQPPAVQTDRERAAIVAGSQAWLAVADEQARAEFAEIEQASAEALEEARACCTEFEKSIHTRADSDLRMQLDRDQRLATRLEELREREKEILRAIADWNEINPCEEHAKYNG